MSDMVVLGSMILGLVVVMFGGYYAYSAWRDLRPGFIKAEIINDEEDVIIRTVKVRKLEGDKDGFHVDKRPYFVDPKKLYRSGKFRMPKAYYKQGNPNPRDMLAVTKPLPDESSQDFQDAIETHVFRDMMEAFRKPILSPEMSFSLLMFAILGGIGWIWYDFGNKLSVISEELTRINGG